MVPDDGIADSSDDGATDHCWCCCLRGDFCSYKTKAFPAFIKSDKNKENRIKRSGENAYKT